MNKIDSKSKSSFVENLKKTATVLGILGARQEIKQKMRPVCHDKSTQSTHNHNNFLMRASHFFYNTMAINQKVVVIYVCSGNKIHLTQCKIIRDAFFDNERSAIYIHGPFPFMSTSVIWLVFY